MRKLLGSALGVVVMAKVAGVLIIVTAAECERDNVVHYRSYSDLTFSLTIFAQPVGAIEAALPLGHTSPAS